jgi:MFS transporter, DHA1 family, multidrug resistance protein
MSLFRNHIRDSPTGQILRFVVKPRILLFDEERPDFNAAILFQDAADNDALERQNSSSGTPRTGQTSDSSLPPRTLAGMAPADLQNRLPSALSREKLDSPQASRDWVLVSWYSVEDPDNPTDWGILKKSYVYLTIYLYDMSVYMGSSIYTAA